MGMAFAFEAELLAIIHVVRYAILYNWTNLWLESDFTYIVSLLLKRTSNVPWSLKVAWSRYLNQISINFQISHIFHKGNFVANPLSKHAVTVYAPSWWFEVSHFACKSYVEDLIG